MAELQAGTDVPIPVSDVQETLAFPPVGEVIDAKMLDEIKTPNTTKAKTVEGFGFIDPSVIQLKPISYQANPHEAAV